MKVLYLASEAAPLVKTGGLGDVAGSLPKALQALGHDVRVAIPGYGAIDWMRLQPVLRARLELPRTGGSQTAEAYEVSVAGVPFYLISGPPIPKDNRVYGDMAEDGPKFLFFSLAALALCRAIDWRPDLLHANDWHTGAAAYWLSAVGRSQEFFRPIASLLTVHNLGYTGRGASASLREYFLPRAAAVDALPEGAQDSLLALGLLTADRVSTVSPTYAREILTPQFGEGLDGVLRLRGDLPRGILNGIDEDLWSPASDDLLPARYDAEHLDGRAANKTALQRELGLPLGDRTPLLGAVSRLDRQKGFDIAAPAVRRWLETDGQFVLLGTGDPAIQAEMASLEWAYPGRASVRVRFDTGLARRIYAGADALLIPSRYEPCGLTQMIGMRYGAVPVARRTGGLADTVVDAGDPDGNGVMFDEYSPAALWDALERARKVYADPGRWSALQRRGMRADFSWRRSAGEYVGLYQEAVAARRAASGAGRRSD